MKIILNSQGEIETIEHPGELGRPNGAERIDWVSGKDSGYDSVFEQNLINAVTVLQRSRVRFGSSDEPRRYEEALWRTGVDRDGDEILILKFGTPAQAVASMFSNLGKWSFDCIEYLQVARWFALLETIGQDAFNRLGGVETFRLSYHRTTGLRSRQTYQRDRSRSEFHNVDTLTGRSTSTGITLATIADEEAFLNLLPIGTRVMWSDSSPHARDEDFENENALTLGLNAAGKMEFIAHPYGRLTAQRLRREMSAPEIDDRDHRAAYIRRYIYIKEIEWYARTI